MQLQSLRCLCLLRSSWLHGWEIKFERTAFSRLAVHFNSAFVRSHDPVHHSQAQACSFADLFSPKPQNPKNMKI